MNSRSLIVLLLITLVAARGNFRQKQPPNQDQAPPPPPPPFNEGQRIQFFDEIKRPIIIQDATKNSQKAISNVNGNEERDWKEVKASWKSNQVEAEIKQKLMQEKIDLNEFFEKKRINDKASQNNFNPDEKEGNKPAEEFNLREELREARRKRREDRWQKWQEKTEGKKKHRDDLQDDFQERNNNGPNQDHQP